MIVNAIDWKVNSIPHSDAWHSAPSSFGVGVRIKIEFRFDEYIEYLNTSEDQQIYIRNDHF